MAPPVRVLARIEGGEELRRALKKHEAEFIRVMSEALPQEGHNLMDQGQAAAPRGSGTLANSAYVDVDASKRGRVRVSAAFLDEKAAAVHEGIHWGDFVEGTKSFKWYEKVFNAFERGFINRIAQRLRRIVGGGA